MDCVELEELCRRALRKMRLELVHEQDNGTGLGTFWLVRPIRPPISCRVREFLLPFAEFECGTARFGAIAASIEEVANRLFNLYEKGTCRFYWKTFYYFDDNGNPHEVENIFAGKSLEEARIMVDLL